MGKMVDGEWFADDISSARTRFMRSPTVFRGEVTPDDAEAGRYHLYVSYACPWAHRTLIVRALRGLEDAVSVSVVHPDMDDDGWRFDARYPGATADTAENQTLLRDVYVLADAHYTGRITVPVLWDKKRSTIVNNESRDIIRFFDTAFDSIASGDTLRPAELVDAIDAALDALYHPVNNGVYRAGFAGTQEAYEEAVTELFGALDHWEEVLTERPFLVGDRVTEADVALFTTLARFDAVYVTHFKCNLRRIRDYPNLWAFLGRMLALPGVAATTRLDHIKRHYFRSHESINPKRLVPLGPVDPLPS